MKPAKQLVTAVQLGEVRSLFADREARCSQLEEQVASLAERFASGLDTAAAQGRTFDRVAAAAAAVAAEWQVTQQRAAAHAAALGTQLGQV